MRWLLPSVGILNYLLLSALLVFNPVTFSANSFSIGFNESFAQRSPDISPVKRLDSTHSADTNASGTDEKDAPNISGIEEEENKELDNRPNYGVMELKSLKPVSKDREAELLGNWGDN